MGGFDPTWAEAVCRKCDPIFASAGAGFERQVLTDGDSGAISALLWEADPVLFAERYPDSGIIETYGGADQWGDVHCIDWWVYVETAARRARLSVEGWNLPELWLPLSGSGAADGARLADLFARLLSVPSPRIA